MSRYTVSGPCDISFPGKTQLMNEEARKLKEQGFDVVVVGYKANHQMLDALVSVGFTVIRQESGERVRAEKQPAPKHAGPRNKWGGLK